MGFDRITLCSCCRGVLCPLGGGSAGVHPLQTFLCPGEMCTGNPESPPAAMSPKAGVQMCLLLANSITCPIYSQSKEGCAVPGVLGTEGGDGLGKGKSPAMNLPFFNKKPKGKRSIALVTFGAPPAQCSGGSELAKNPAPPAFWSSRINSQLLHGLV